MTLGTSRKGSWIFDSPRPDPFTRPGISPRISSNRLEAGIMAEKRGEKTEWLR
jgi:hypothetical protein